MDLFAFPIRFVHSGTVLTVVACAILGWNDDDFTHRAKCNNNKITEYVFARNEEKIYIFNLRRELELEPMHTARDVSSVSLL